MSSGVREMLHLRGGGEASWHLEKVEGLKAEAALKELKEAEALLMRRMWLIKIARPTDLTTVQLYQR